MLKFSNVLQSMVKMSLLGPFCFGLLLISFVEGTPTKGLVQLRREKRDVEILAACDEHCLPEDQIKDYDMLLQYDEDPDAIPGPFLVDFEKKSCAFACKIVDMNKTEGSNGALDGEFSITSVEELPDESSYQTSRFHDVNPLRTMVGLNKNVHFSPSVNENLTVRPEFRDTSSICGCNNNVSNATNTRITTPTPEQLSTNATESILSNQNLSSIVVKDVQGNSTDNSGFMKYNNSVINGTTTQKQQFSVVPVIPKVIRFTVVEAEMAEAGVTTAPKVEKKQDNSYLDVTNNASLVLKSLLESLAQHGVLGSKVQAKTLGLRNYSHEHEEPFDNQKQSSNLTRSTVSSKVSQITEAVTKSTTLPSQVIVRETLNSDYSTVKSLPENEFQLERLDSNRSLNFSQEKIPAPTQEIIDATVEVNMKEIIATTPLLLKTSPSVTVTSFEHSLNSMEATKSNAVHNVTTSKPEVITKFVLYPTEPFSGNSKATSSSPTKVTADLDTSTTTYVAIHPTGNDSKTTDLKLNHSNENIFNNKSVLLEARDSNKQSLKKNNLTELNNCSALNKTDERCNSFNKSSIESSVPRLTNASKGSSSNSLYTEKNDTTKKDYLLKGNNHTRFINSTNLNDDEGNVTGNHNDEKLPAGSEKSPTLRNTWDELVKNDTLSNLSVSNSSSLTEADLQLLSFAKLTNISLGKDKEIFNPDSLMSINTTENIHSGLLNIYNQSSVLPHRLQDFVSSTDGTNATEFLIYNNISIGNNSPTEIHQEIPLHNINNRTQATLNVTTTLHKIL